jgi:hypothetical protein
MIPKLFSKNQISAYNRSVFHDAPWFFEVFGIPGTDGSFESDFSANTRDPAVLLF